MLKRIISGVLASVLLFLSIPTVSFAADTFTEADIMDITAGWMTALFNKCYNTEQNSFTKGGVDDSGNVTFGMGLISVKVTGSDNYITLCPYITNNGKGDISFDHVRFKRFIKPNDISDTRVGSSNAFNVVIGSFRNIIKNSQTGDLIIGNASEGGADNEDFEGNGNNDDLCYIYGSIGLSNSTSKINPIYNWYEYKGEKKYIQSSGASAVTHFYGLSTASVDVCKTDAVHNRMVDALSLLLFVAKMHTLYHTESVWDTLSGSVKTSIGEYSFTDLYDKLSTQLGWVKDTCCTSETCGILQCLTTTTTKGTIGTWNGRHGDMQSAADIYAITADSHTRSEGYSFGVAISKSVDMIASGVWSQPLTAETSKLLPVKNSSILTSSTIYDLNAISSDTTPYTTFCREVLSDEINFGGDTYYTNDDVVKWGDEFKSRGTNITLLTKGDPNSIFPTEETFNDYLCEDFLDRLAMFRIIMKFFYEHGFLTSETPCSGEFKYVTEMYNMLSYMSNYCGSGKLINTFGDCVGIANKVSNEFEDTLKKAQTGTEEEHKKNRAKYSSTSLVIGGKTAFTSQIVAIPTILGDLKATDDYYVDVKNLFNTMAYSTKCATYEVYSKVTDVTDMERNSVILALTAALCNSSSYSQFKKILFPDDVNWNGSGINIFTQLPNDIQNKPRLKDTDLIIEKIMKELVNCLYTKDIPSHIKYAALHRIWIAVYETDNFFDSGEPTWYKDMTSRYGIGDVTIAGQATIDSFEAQYDMGTSMSSDELLSGGLTLELRSNIIDTFAKYNFSEDIPLIEKVIADTEKISKANKGTQLQTEVKYYEPMTYENAGKYFYYQMLLLYEAQIDANLIHGSLLTAIINDGITLEGNGKQITILSNIKAVLDKYRGKLAEDIWNEKRDAGDAELTDEQESLLSLSGVYDYLIKMGFISSAEYEVDIYDEQDPLTLFWTQTGSNDNITFSRDYYKGRALSATYIPMQTNIYDPYSMLDYVDTEWVEDFHYKYGFYRKALFIDTNTDAAVDSYVSNTQGPTRIATLQDLFNCESDIVLYIDEHFYGLTELSELQDKTYDRLASTNPTLFDSIVNSISDMFSMFREVDFDVALKQTVSTYSREIHNKVSGMDLVLEYDDNNKLVTKLQRYDQYILTPDTIKEYIGKEEYTPMIGYAVVSNIYRNPDAFRVVNNVSVSRTPVFESSPTLATISGSSTQAKNTLYNYALLKNLSAMTTVGYETSADMSSPIYCDIYGNIVTESGLVVIPAACNATLHGGDTWQPICTGFLSTYGKEWYIPTSWNLDEDFMTKMFYKNEELGQWEIRNKTIQNMEINFAQLSYADKAVNTALKEWYNFDLVNGKNTLNQYNSLNILHEVLRGAPIENIDFDAENLNSARKVDKSGLIAAAKLDNIVNSLDWDDENSIMSIPRLSFIDNYQYVVVFIFKVLLVIVVTALMITIYVDVLKTKISWRTLGRCVGTLVLGVACVLMIPISYDISYYQSNKLLLQDEAEYIMMLNTEKNMSGREIGVYEVTEPEQHTQILIKLEDFEFNWLEVLPSVITSDSINVMDAKYKEFLNNSLLANKDNVQAMNDGMYMDVQDIFDTSVLNFSTTSKQLYQKVSVDPVASYYIPYYYFLDALLTNMNDFNRSNNVYAYSTKIMRGGAVKTVNLCSAYFNSKEFMEGNDSDYLGLYQLYDTMGSMIILPIFNEESIEPARQSQWYVGTLMPEEDVLARVQLMDTKVKQFIMENKNLIGKVTDETFLKCMAMDLAIEYNNIFGIPSANAFEVYNLSNADLMRLTIANKASTLEGSPMSFSRFVYNEAGTPGVYASVFLVITTMFVQTMKTIITIAIMALLVISVFVFKILLRKSNNSIAGYLLTLLVICSTNILYAVILKVSLAIPQTGLAPTLCIIIQIIIQLAYLWVLTVVLGFALRDWKNIGFTKYQTIGHNLKEKFSRRHSRSPKDRYDSQPRGVDGWDYYRKLVKENEQRMKKVGTH